MIKHPSIPLVSLGADIPDMARQWRNDPKIRAWCRQYTLLSDDDHIAWLHTLYQNQTIKMFSIQVENRSVGVCGLTSIDRVNQKAEFSLYIAPEEQRKGYGRKALLLLLMHGFRDQNLNRIWGESFDGNPAQETFGSVGMSLEGTFRQSYYRDGKFIASHIWAITRSEFNERYRDRFSDGDERARSSSEPIRSEPEPDGPSKASAIAAGISNRNSPLTYEEANDIGGSWLTTSNQLCQRCADDGTGTDEAGDGEAGRTGDGV